MDSSAYRERAEAIFAVFASRLESLPVAVPEMLRAVMLHSLPVQQVHSPIVQSVHFNGHFPGLPG